MSTNLTAVQWLISQVDNKRFRDVEISIPQEVKEEALQMEVKQTNALVESNVNLRIALEGLVAKYKFNQTKAQVKNRHLDEELVFAENIINETMA